jgi:pimeloyl-ACP methyl ester carboxylesterase
VRGAVLVNTTFAATTVGPGGVPQRLAPLGEMLRRFVDANPKRADRLRLAASDLTTLIARTIFGANASARQVAVAFHMYETTPAQTLAAATDMLSYDVADDLERIDVPVLVVGGDRDLLTPVHLSRRMAEIIPDAELVIFDGCGHMAPFERHEELTAHVRKFTDRVLR